MVNYEFNIVYFYGNLMNIYGDNGNFLMLKYVVEKMGVFCYMEIVSIYEFFDVNKYDLVFFGGG